jgi:thiol:disulfide interchange protein DsbD
MFFRGLLFIWLLFGATVSLGLVPDTVVEKEPVKVEAFIAHDHLAAGGSTRVALRIIIDKTWHINSNKPYQDFLIPTVLKTAENESAKLSNILYPKGHEYRPKFVDEALSVYEGEVWVSADLSLPSNTRQGVRPLRLVFREQACNDSTCLQPENLSVDIPVNIAGVGATTTTGDRHTGLFGSIDMRVASSGVTLDPADAEFIGMLKDFNAETFVDTYGYFLAYIALFILGIGLTLTPCVYPIIPITVGYFGAQGGSSVKRQWLLAMFFGGGIAISYASLGTFAAFSGAIFGAILQKWWVLVLLAGLCVAMGLNAFGMFEIRMPSKLMGLSGTRGGLLGAGMMGLTMGIAAAPCLAAFVVSLLAFVGQKGDPFLGFTMFLALGSGLAIPFVVLGFFSGNMQRLPSSGAWMVYVRRLMGSLLFVAALYFLNTLLPEAVLHGLVVVGAIVAAIYFGFLESTPVRSNGFKFARIMVAVLFVGTAGMWGYQNLLPKPEVPKASWIPYEPDAYTNAIGTKPILIDFYADWCLPCKRLDKEVFSHPEILELSKNFVMIKADLTRSGNESVKEAIKRFKVDGVPAVVFIKASGEESKSDRIYQFEGVKTFSSIMKRLLNDS